MSAFAVEEVLRPSSGMSCDGFWSGTEERQHQPYIAMIPECRYLDPSQILERAIFEYRQLTAQPPRVEKPLPPAFKLSQKKIDAAKEYSDKENAKRMRMLETQLELYRAMVDFGGARIPAHMSGWAYNEINAWINANGHTDLEAAIIQIHEQGA